MLEIKQKQGATVMSSSILEYNSIFFHRKRTVMRKGGGVTLRFQARYKAETYIMKLLGEKKQQGH